jgi:p-hydroxybenzoate 3-monooxygenase
VVIIGAGPAGLVLGNLLLENQIECIIVERQCRDYVESRARAGVFEHRAVELLKRHGLADRLLHEGRQVGICEFRVDDVRLLLRYGDILHGNGHLVYPQHKIVRDLIELFQKRGGKLYFSADDATLDGIEGTRPSVSFVTPDERYVVDCDIIAGCDGDNGVCRQSIPAGGLRKFDHRYPVDFLSILAATPPLAAWNIYALHGDGFAGQMLRSPEQTRFYVQCPVADSLRAWPDDRIWSTLRHRLATDSGDAPAAGPVLDKDVLHLRSTVYEPMRYGRLFLAGDAAHLIPPAGGKGMNLAIADAAELASALVGRFQHGDESRCAAYSATRLPHIWAAQEFSQWLLDLLSMPAEHGVDRDFHACMQRARVNLLRTDETYAAAFAERYAGVR